MRSGWRVWLVAAALAFVATSALAQPAAPGGAVQAAAQAAAPTADPDRVLALTASRLKAQLQVGDALVKAGRWAEALPHFREPVNRLYDSLRIELDKRNIPPFGDALETLARIVRRQSDMAGYEGQRQKVTGSINDVLRSIPPEKLDDPRFVTAMSGDLVAQAAEAYAAAVEGGSIRRLGPYREGLGYVWQAGALIESLKEAEGDADRLRETLLALTDAWPGLDPPAVVTLTPDQVRALAEGLQPPVAERP